MTLRTALFASLSSLTLAACAHKGVEPAQTPQAAYGHSSPPAKSAYQSGGAADAELGTASPRASAPAAESEVAPRDGAGADVAARDEARPGLGTSWGESIESRVRHTRFTRAEDRPFATASFLYNDEAGATAMAGSRFLDWRDSVVNVRGGRVTVSLTDPSGAPLRAVETGDRTIAVGNDGDRYVIRVDNRSPYRLEAVATVDGLDVLDGEDGSPDKRGYILSPYDSLQIEGFRESEGNVRAFRFGSVSDSYADRRGKGRNVGVVGIALFGEQGSNWNFTPEEIHRRNTADPFPGSFAPAPPPRRYMD